ncbi:hypothetical protein COV12_02750 [Candidatus Woesearchaeota archaeon CG10_big_fil_rev_8_21_14_0_10_32_24]|nr:MAG: hypothetical protein COV12_02750 [Candidatus Woesearchaeota archaeon CG10_big_fil_rev_8_21_14_0_10_32_24]
MKLLSGQQYDIAESYLNSAANVATLASCYRSKCGTIIVKDNEIIGEGYNSPPLHCSLESCLKDNLPASFKSDKTCCMHAEQRAIMDALRKHPEKMEGSRLYFIRLDQEGNKTKAGDPYCTICSKMALDVGVKEFVLWREEGICVYDTREYNDLSFQFQP